MIRKNNPGICLRRQEPSGKKAPVWLLNMGLSAAACGVLLWMSGKLIELWEVCTPVPALSVGCAVCLLGHLLKAGRKGSWFSGTVLALLLVLILLLRELMADGIALVWNCMGDVWTSHTGWVLPDLAVKGENTQGSLLLVTVVAGALVGLVCTVPEKVRWTLLGVLLSGLLLAGMAVPGREDMAGLTVLGLGGSLLLLIHNGSESRAAKATAVGWTAGACILCVLVWTAGLPVLREWSRSASERLKEEHHVKKYETGYTVLPEGDLSAPVELREDPVSGLVVTMDQPERMYFRGFVGEMLEGDVWTPLEPELLAENRELLYWLNLYEFQPGQQFRAAVSGLVVAENTVTVQNIGACSQNYYLPFSLSGGMELPAENLNSAAENSTGSRIYVFSAAADSAGRIPEVLEYLENSEDPAVSEYRQAESAYRVYVYENYLQIPEAVELLLKEAWDACGTREEMSLEETQLAVKRFLELCYPGEGASAGLELPVSEVGGSSFQRATVEVMTLRYFGIPARYAEGYVLTAQMAEEAAPGSPIRLDSSCARAWAEIYQEGIGWIPMELTQTAEESGDESPDDNGMGADAEKPGSGGVGNGSGLKEGQELEETVPETEPQNENPNTDFELELPDTLLRAVLVMYGLLLLALLVLLVRYRILRVKRERRYHEGTDSDAAAYLFADSVLILAELGFDRGNGPVSGLYQSVRDAYGPEYAGKLRTMTALNDQAMFSSRILTPEQKRYAAAFREDTLEQMKKDTTWNQRLRLKWIRCLY